MLLDILMVLAGLVFLYFGGEWLLRGSVSLARAFGLSNLIVSAVIIGFGTSMPELTVSAGAALRGSSDIALGNVIGSNLANMMLIIPFAALFSPLLLKEISVRRDVGVMFAATAVFAAVVLMDGLVRLTGALFFIGLLGYISWSYFEGRRENAEKQKEKLIHDVEEDHGFDELLTPGMASVYTIGGLLVLVAGAALLVEGAVSIAREVGVSEAIIGLTLVAIGTSLPELATAAVASLKKRSDVIIGNILGSNIFNILAILGITSMILPIPVTPQIASFDIWVLMAVTFFFGFILLLTPRIGRLLGGAMMVSYFSYIAFLFVSGGI